MIVISRPTKRVLEVLTPSETNHNRWGLLSYNETKHLMVMIDSYSTGSNGLGAVGLVDKLRRQEGETLTYQNKCTKGQFFIMHGPYHTVLPIARDFDNSSLIIEILGIAIPKFWKAFSFRKK